LRGVLRDLLSGTGYTVIEAGDGEAGVAADKSDHPDLILMNIQMPALDVYETTRRKGGAGSQANTDRCSQAHLP